MSYVAPSDLGLTGPPHPFPPSNMEEEAVIKRAVSKAVEKGMALYTMGKGQCAPALHCGNTAENTALRSLRGERAGTQVELEYAL